MTKKEESIENDDDYNLLLADLVGIVENSRSLANEAICSSINKVFAENKIDLKVFSKISTNPLALKILGLKNPYENKTEREIILMKIEEFLVNFKMSFATVYRDKEFKIGKTSYCVDLVLFNRRLKCLVIIDLKLGKFSRADVGQMLLYTNYANEHRREEGENPPVGLICATKKAMR